MGGTRLAAENDSVSTRCRRDEVGRVDGEIERVVGKQPYNELARSTRTETGRERERALEQWRLTEAMSRFY